MFAARFHQVLNRQSSLQTQIAYTKIGTGGEDPQLCDDEAALTEDQIMMEGGNPEEDVGGDEELSVRIVVIGLA